MTKLKIFLFAIILITAQFIVAQSNPTYAFRGTIVDHVDQQPIIGAIVYVVNHEDISGLTDEYGTFTIRGLPLGRHSLFVTYLGYVNYMTPIEITSGKELVLNIALKEDITSLKELVVKIDAEKSKSVNALAYGSTRTFSVEETKKYAGAVDDPARMATSFAGVVPTNDGSNYVSIRGNHPSTLLYRLEGIDITNPNHFGDVASSGGGISVLSSQMLSNSDFSTGAFSAEYGNALGGVFDLRLRKGNNSKREVTLKAGLLGMEAAIEGPFSKKSRASYLINYRYSTLSLIDKLGIDLTGVLNYSDLSYNFFLPVGRNGYLSAFGINGKSSQHIDDDLQDIEYTDAIAHYSKSKFLSDMSVNGIKYNLSVGKNGYISSVLSYSTTNGGIIENVKTVYSDENIFFYKNSIQSKNNKVSAAVNYTSKINKKTTLRIGVNLDKLAYSLKFDDYIDDNNFINLINSNDQTSLVRGYSQLHYRFNEKWSTNVGLHYTNFILNNSQAIEPRLNVQYEFNQKSNIAIAYGKHSQIQPLLVYFVKSNEDNQLINKNLGLTKAHHLVLTYNYDLNKYTRLKSELYCQNLYDIPVGQGENNTYAIINQEFGFPDFRLTSDGKGRNLGLELTLERFLQKGWYYILTASLYDSKYKTPTTTWHNTRYNGGYSSVITIGKEWVVSRSKRNTLGFNIKNANIGGQWNSPIDIQASNEAKMVIRNEDKPFSHRLKNYHKLDVSLKYKRNHAKYTSTLSLDILNATNIENISGESYNVFTQKIEKYTMMPLVPIMSYKVEF